MKYRRRAVAGGVGLGVVFMRDPGGGAGPRGVPAAALFAEAAERAAGGHGVRHQHHRQVAADSAAEIQLLPGGVRLLKELMSIVLGS
eukprot:9034759-Pyramimonas_sp.AAC.2